MSATATPAVTLTSSQQVTLVLLRTLVGWHLFYEGYVKLLHPAWSRAGAPLERFSSAPFLRAATGPFADLFHALAGSAWLPWIDAGVAAALVVSGALLMLGLFTQAACALAFTLLALFYLAAIPLQGVPEPRAEGAYLIVNKNLVEAASVAVVFVFRTGRIAGLDCARRAGVRAAAREAST
jgi:thiosulfate dehydrogenase [quinone] large subunit